MGDFNCPDIDWASLHGSNPVSVSLCEFVFNFNLCQVVPTPTHTKGNVLDLVLTQNPESIMNLSVHSSMSFLSLPPSDHYPVSFFLSCRVHTSIRPSTPSFNYKKGDYIGLNDYLLNLDWEGYFSTQDIEQLLSLLKSAIYDSCCKFIPLIIPHRYPRWFTGPIRHKLHKVRSLRKREARNSSPAVVTTLEQAEQELQADI